MMTTDAAETGPTDVQVPADSPRRWLPPALSRIRSKLIFLHTSFSLALALVLLVVLRVPVNEMVASTEQGQARLIAQAWTGDPDVAQRIATEGMTLDAGSAGQLDIPPDLAAAARSAPGTAVMSESTPRGARAVRWDPRSQQFLAVTVQSTAARSAVNRLYLMLTLALLGVYGLIALALEAVVLPRQVYRPLKRLRTADEAVQRGQRESELIPERDIPSDELGQIMRWRNQSIVKLRRQERALEEALMRFEAVAAELKRKNHLLETARRNLTDQDRLVSIGMMSAGLAHELNTPLAVIKGCVEELSTSPAQTLPKQRIELMQRVVERLETLSESLLDFARARPPVREPVDIVCVIDEAWTLVSIDRGVRRDIFENRVRPVSTVLGDADRLTQVLVNLLRNAVDALDTSDAKAQIVAQATSITRDGENWLSVVLSDTGPGIDAAVLDRLFEPFASTRLDAQGTGLGLAVAEGIVREHGGAIIARNAPEGGAQFEILLPVGDQDVVHDNVS